jgi:hypothetical protein
VLIAKVDIGLVLADAGTVVVEVTVATAIVEDLKS